MKEYIDHFYDSFKSFAKKDHLSFDFYAWDHTNHYICFEKQKLQNYSSSKDKNLTLRLVSQDKTGVSYTKNFSQEGLKECYNQALQSLKLSDKKEKAILCTQQNYVDDFAYGYHPDTGSMHLSEKIQKVKQMDQAALSVGKEIQPVMNVCKDRESSYIFGNSHQAQGSYLTNNILAYSYSLAIDKNKRSQGMSQQSARDYTKIEFHKLGEESAFKSLKKLNFEIPKTDRYPVIFKSGQVASTFISLLLSHLDGKKVYDKVSLLTQALNLKKLSDSVTLYDNPFASWGFRSAPFDGEGFACQKTTLVENGTIKNYLTNSVMAQKLKVPHTAKASRSEHALVEVSPTNIIMKKGEASFLDLIQEHPQVIVIDFLKGLAGYNEISGNFSIESEGFLWSRGEPAKALCQFTVSGNLIDIFARISKVANDSLLYNGTFNIPSFLVSKLSIAGA